MNKIMLLLFILLIPFANANDLEYDFESTDCIKIPLKITKTIKTSKKDKAYEGEKLNFIVDKNIFFENKLIVKRGTLATARLEIIINRGFAGTPAEIYITDFNIPNLDNNKIMEPIIKRGFSTATLILPIKRALTPLPPFGSLTNIIIGFNTKLTPKDTIYVSYFPNYKI